LDAHPDTPWLTTLGRLVEKNPIAVLRFDTDEWERLRESRRGIHEFTVARAHALLDGVRPPTPCLFEAAGVEDRHLYFGLISSRSPVTTLESRIKIRRSVQIQPQSTPELLITEKIHANNLTAACRGAEPFVKLGA
jgi:hypothetical protein